MAEYKVSDYVVDHLEAEGVTCAYELAGGMLAHLLDSFALRRTVRLVSMHHEQGAGFAAEGHARMTGVPGVALATSGPGATNLLTAMGSCYFDSTPAVFLTGQVNRHELKGDRPIRQLGFQETDIVAMARPISKGAWRAGAGEEVPGLLARAFELARGGRPGPVLLDLPMDVQRLTVEAPPPARRERPGPRPERVPASSVDDLLAALRRSERPLLLAGGGIRSGGAGALFARAAERLGIPVVHSLMGRDALPFEHPQSFGMIGSYGNRWANHALGECDLLLVVGSRLDIRQTGTDTEGLARRPIFQVDCDPGEMNNRVRGVHAVCADVKDFLAALLAAAPAPRPVPAWFAHLAELRARWPDEAELAGAPGLNPNRFLRRLGAASRAAAAFVVDVGQHQMWAGQSLAFAEGQRFLTSGGMGAMGFALPAAVGASFACPGRPILAVAGDGGFQLNVQELQTVATHRLPLKLVVLNNRCHGMVRQFQESYFEGRYQSTVDGYDAPDFARVAAAYGLPSRRLDGTLEQGEAARDAAAAEALAWLWSDPSSPALLEVLLPIGTNVYPKLAFGRPITEMEPLAKPLEMEGT
ncbi:thiamine pyrophosphate-binding protein [Anaeromyxobacter paludicola]|uniref:Acetolactate synthase n=1 Tax=Anaeromyxobacter paludicola TaxID=2918171 RepID=A0ABN6N536_9BACT|nr:thiamine pyrophosphate-binding protein [Anaeromyxobacter paludicola]BDG07173.1 acetolactate synthase [Anaeromyxobacter paludicola]